MKTLDKNITVCWKQLLVIMVIVLVQSVEAQIVWNVKEKYGTIDAVSLQQAVNDALKERKTFPDEDVILSLDAGTYYLNKEVLISSFNPAGLGWLIIQGAGEDKTELIDVEYDSDSDVTFQINQPYRFKIADLKLTGERLTSSQGTIVNMVGQYLDIKLDEGYPTPDELFEIETNKANKIRIMLDTELNSPHYIEGNDNDHQSNRWTFQGDYDSDGNPQTRPSWLYGRTWRFKLTSADPHPFLINDRVGVSSKSNRSNWAAFSGNGADVVVENLTLQRLGRVKFRRGWQNIRFTNVKIIRTVVNGKAAFYSTDAGPQFGHDSDGLDVYNLIVENCDIRGTVDDGIAFQRVKSGLAVNNRWEDGGGALIGINCSNVFLLENNTYYHCPMEDDRPGAIHFKGAYQPQVEVNETGWPVSLSWLAGTRAELHDVYLGTGFPLPLVASSDATNHELPDDLLPNTTYYWMVYERNVSEALGTNESDVWTFTTPSNISAGQDAERQSIEVYPNPVNDYLVVKGVVNELMNCQLFNLWGQNVTSLTPVNQGGEGTLIFSMGALEAGVYVLKTKVKNFRVVKK
jgi:hypothetical protein